MLDEQGIRSLLPRPQGTTGQTTTSPSAPPASLPTSLPTSLPSTPADPMAQSLPDGAVQQTEDRYLFNNPAEKVTYDAVTGAPGQDLVGLDGAGLSMPPPPTTAGTPPDITIDLSESKTKASESGWTTWIMIIALLVAFLLCIGFLMTQGRRAPPAYGGGYGGGGYGGF